MKSGFTYIIYTGGNGCSYTRDRMEYADIAPRYGRGRDRSGTSEAT